MERYLPLDDLAVSCWGKREAKMDWFKQAVINIAPWCAVASALILFIIVGAAG